MNDLVSFGVIGGGHETQSTGDEGLPIWLSFNILSCYNTSTMPLPLNKGLTMSGAMKIALITKIDHPRKALPSERA